MAREWRWSFLILLLGCLSQTTEAASVFNINRFHLKEPLDTYSEMLLSPSAEAADVIDRPATDWQAVSDAHRFAAGDSLIWLKSTVQNQLQVPVEVTLRLKTSLFSNARFFIIDRNILTEQTQESVQSTNMLSFADIRPSYSLTLEPGAVRVVLVSIKSHAPHDFHWELRDTQSHRRESFQYMLRWTFLLAALLLVSLFAGAQGLTQKRSIPFALALYVLLSLLFLLRLTHWPLLAIFWESLGDVLPPLNHILCAVQASLVILLRRLSYGLEPKRLLQKLYWLALGLLVLYLSLIVVLHQNQSLLLMLPSEALLLLLLGYMERLSFRQKHPRLGMIRLLLLQQSLLFIIHALILIDAFPLWHLPEVTLWIYVVGSSWLVFMGRPSYQVESARRNAKPSPLVDANSQPKPDEDSGLPHEQWLHVEKMAALGTFTNGLANEFNNPLAIIAGHRFRLASMMSSRSFDTHEFEKSLGKIDHAVNRMIAVIDALKVYSQDPEGEGIFKTFSLRETIKYTNDLCRDKLVSCGIKLSTSELDDATMEGHQGQIIQVLLILVDNAIDALEQASDKTIRIELQPLPDRVRIAVIDSGSGVPHGLRGKIWAPFFTSKDSFRHKGLGLSIASGIISNHRGRLILDDSTPETRFIVELPRKRQPPSL